MLAVKNCCLLPVSFKLARLMFCTLSSHVWTKGRHKPLLQITTLAGDHRANFEWFFPPLHGSGACRPKINDCRKEKLNHATADQRTQTSRTDHDVKPVLLNNRFANSWCPMVLAIWGKLSKCIFVGSMWEKEKAGIQQNMVSISTQFRRMKKNLIVLVGQTFSCYAKWSLPVR